MKLVSLFQTTGLALALSTSATLNAQVADPAPIPVPAPAPVPAQAPAAVPHKPTAHDLMLKGDHYDVRLQPQQALNYYLPALQMHPKSVPLLVRIARQYRHLMTDTPHKDEKLRLGQVALGYSQKAAALGTHDAEAQLSPAITYGKMLPFQGSREQVEGSAKIKESVDKALKLDPQNDTAWHVLGRWHQVLAGIGTVKRTLGRLIYGALPESTNEEAIKCFNKAIALNPHRLRHHIELGRTYAQAGNTEEARRHIQKGLAMANVEKDDPEMKEKGKETLAKLR